jgi:hypothetical protein
MKITVTFTKTKNGIHTFKIIEKGKEIAGCGFGSESVDGEDNFAWAARIMGEQVTQRLLEERNKNDV